MSFVLGMTVPDPIRSLAAQRLRQVANIFFFALCLALVSGRANADDSVGKLGRPNVVIIYADDLGWGDLQCYGHPKFKTPHIDRLASEGTRLTNFYSCCPYCAPSRAGLMTGRYQFRNGLYSNPFPSADRGGQGRGDKIGLPAEEITLGEAFQSAGYRTACIGKWHLGHMPQFRPRKNGFDEYYGILYSNDMHPVELFDGERMVEYPVVQATLTRRYTERALAFLENNRDRPFLLYLPHAMPHKPLACSEEFYEKSGAGLYGDAMAELDWSVGRLCEKLKELKLDEKTLVFFSSDNGPWYGGSSGGLRGMKSQVWEGGIRVPLIARWPGKIPAGQILNEPAIILDLFTTSLTAAGIPIPSDRPIDGKDILPLLTSGAKSPHEALFSMTGDKLGTVRSGKWKMVLIPQASARAAVGKDWKPGTRWIDPRRPDGVTILAPYEQSQPDAFPGLLTGDAVTKVGLFDLESDPGEQQNVAEQNPEIVARLRGYADKLIADFPEKMRARQ